MFMGAPEHRHWQHNSNVREEDLCRTHGIRTKIKQTKRKIRTGKVVLAVTQKQREGGEREEIKTTKSKHYGCIWE